MLFFFIAIIALGTYQLVNPEPEGFKKQAAEESLAEQYLQEAGNENGRETAKNTDEAAKQAEIEIGRRYTPNYAKGFLQCVLQIPSVGICRGVYSGTPEEIEYDLASWMLVSARPDYVLGKTHYCIYGHNHPVENLSFNRIKDVREGDEIRLQSLSAAYIYKVIRIFADTKEQVTDKYVDDFSLTSDFCYIITCGRGAYDNLDLVVEAQLVSVE